MAHLSELAAEDCEFERLAIERAFDMRPIRALRGLTTMKQKTSIIPLAQIENKFDVRIKLDEDRILILVGLYEGGIELPPIKVVRLDDDKYAYVDGRHRGAARAYLNQPDIEAIVLTQDRLGDPIGLFVEALQANYGGAKPPTRDDVAHTVIRMMELGAKQVEIKERLSFMPIGSINMYIGWAKGVLHKRKMRSALDLIADGSSVNDAAAEVKLKPDVIRDFLQGKKRKWGKDTSSEKQQCNELKIHISKSLRTANSSIGKKIEGLLKAVDDGEISLKVAESVVNAWESHLSRTLIRVKDWQSRFVAVASNQSAGVRRDDDDVVQAPQLSA